MSEQSELWEASGSTYFCASFKQWSYSTREEVSDQGLVYWFHIMEKLVCLPFLKLFHMADMNVKEIWLLF